MQDEDAPRPMTSAAMLSVAVMMAYQAGSRATRDTLFLDRFSPFYMPAMITLAALPAILAAAVCARMIARQGPRRFVPRLFLVSAILTLAEWALALRAPRAGAFVVYLHVAAISPLLLSGFWSIFNEEYDPRSAKRTFGPIAAVGTVGALASFVLGERLTRWTGPAGTLPWLAGLQLLGAWSVTAMPATWAQVAARGDAARLSTRDAARLLVTKSYLRNLALLVVGSSVAATLVDFVFVVQTRGGAHNALDLMRVFGGFHVAVTIATIPAQALLARFVLERAGGVENAIGALPATMTLGGGIAALVPGPVSVAVTKGLGAVVRGSLFRSGADVLYTAIPAAGKRATKLLVDVGCDRLGDVLGAGTIGLVLLAAPATYVPALLAACAVLSALTFVLVSRIRRGYVTSLVEDLRDRVIDRRDLDRGEMTTMLTLARLPTLPPTPHPTPAGREIADLVRELASPDPLRVRGALRDASPLDPVLVPQAIRLLANRDVAPDAAHALLPVASRHVGQLVDALLDPDVELFVRAGVPWILGRCPGPRAIDGLTRGLDDARFDVRYACGRALLRMLEREPGLAVERDRILAAVVGEARHERRVWQSQRALDQLPDANEEADVDAFLRDRAGKSLEHVFTLLSLVLPREPVRLAYRALLADQPVLRGRALEYLEIVLPPAVREVLWTHLEPGRPPGRTGEVPLGERERVLDELLRSSPSIELSIDALRRRRDGGNFPGPPGVT